MKPIYIQAVDILTPGLEGWLAAQPVLSGQQPYLPSQDLAPKYQATLLPPNERRRATSLTRLVFQLGELLLKRYPTLDASQWQTVFASSGGDYQIIDSICQDLARDSDISPTQFHNSVHNAVAGYWSIATANIQPSTSIAAYNATFAAAMVEASLLAGDSEQPVFCCIYDATAFGLLKSLRNISQSFASAFLLETARSDASLGQINCRLVQGNAVPPCSDPALEALRLGNSAARALPLLEAIAQNRSATLFFEMPTGQLAVDFVAYGR